MQAVTGPGRVVAGRYELLDRIGQGAMGTVWRARDLVLTREVAIKEIRLPGLMPDEDRKVLRERTMREARVSAKLSHPGVVTVYDVIEAGGTPWIVMELVAARSLEQVLAQDGPLPARQVASIGVMLLGALASAHAAGIVHRDVKPGNVLITRDHRTVLTDFGIATLDGDPGLTQAGMVMGTPGFCAPERIRGEPASPASDLWSLGATLYTAVEGRGPFEGHGSPMAVLASIVHSDPPRVQAHGQLGTVIHSLMSKEPGRRPDAACAIRQLADVAAGNSGTILAASPYPGGTRPATNLTSAVDRTGPTGFPVGPATSGAAPAGAVLSGAAPGGMATGGTSPGGTTRGGTVQFPAGAGPDFWPPSAGPGGAGLAAAAAPVADLTTQTAPAGAIAPAAAAFPPSRGAPFPADPAGVPFPDGVGDVKFPVGPGAAVPLWAGSGWPGSSPATGSPATGSRTATGSLGSTGQLGPAVAGPPCQPEPQGQQDTLSQPTGRATGSRGLLVSLAGAAIVLVGLMAGVLFARASGTGQPSTGGTGGPSPAALPAGYHWYSQPAAAGTAAGFAMAVPDGWQGSHQGPATDLRSPLTGGTITASFAPFTVSGPVREAQALELAAVSQGTYPGYRLITITPWLLRGQLAGAWRFSYRQTGTGLIEGLEVVSDLPTASGPQPYELLVTAPVMHWPASKAAFAEALRTLRAGR